MPTYPFQYQRCWIDRASTPFLHSAPANSHPLLGQKLSISRSPSLYFESQVTQEQPAFLNQHLVFGKAILPAAGYIEIALAAGRQVLQSEQITLINLAIGQPIELSKQVRTIQSVFAPDSKFEILSQSVESEDWNFHATGSLRSPGSPVGKVDLLEYQTICNQEVSLVDYYSEFRSRGIEYGTDFQAIQKLWKGEGQALGQIQLPVSLTVHPYQIHPVLLDAAFQVIGAALPHADTATYLPVGCDRLTLYQTAGETLWSYAQLRSVEQQQVADLTLFSSDGTVIVAIEGLQLRRAGAISDRANFQDWFYQIEWRRQPLLPVAGSLPDTIRDRLLPELAAAFTQLVDYQALLSKLEDLSLGYVLDALKNLNWQPLIGQRYSTAELAQQLGVVAQQQSLLHRLLEILAEEGILQAQDQQWQVMQALPIMDCAASLTSLQTDVTAELTLLHRCGTQLAQVLQGKTDPLHLLFPEGDLTTVTQLYQDSVGARQMNQAIQQILRTVIEQKPVAQSLRLLEIGAGTGSTTAYLLPELNAESDRYLFTDISPLFLSKAKQKFQNYSFVEYQVLDIERSPLSQKFDSHQYDIVIAANVIHATKDLQQSFNHIHSLLAPGGLLILLEGIRPMRWLDLTFGLTEGWWRFSDRHLRPNHPLLPARQWQQVMASAGLKAAVVSPDAAAQAVFVAQALPDLNASHNASHNDSQADVILCDRQGLGQQLAEQLQAQGRTVVQVFAESSEQQSDQIFSLDPTSLSETQQLLETLKIRYAHLRIIYLWSLDLPAADSAHLLTTVTQSSLSLLHWIQAIDRTSASLWLVTQGAISTTGEPILGITQTPLWGIGKVINLEYPKLTCKQIDLNSADSAQVQVQQLLLELQTTSQENQIALRDRHRYVARLKQVNETELALPFPGNQAFQLASAARGTLENLIFQPATRRSPQPQEVEIRVRATGLNFIDVLDALGLLPFAREGFGVECAGEIVAVGEAIAHWQIGDRVAALAPHSFGQYVTIDAAMVMALPSNLSFEEAATIPANFLTADYALRQVAKITEGDRVLIHAAATGTGMAAVQIAQQAGAEIFATASPAKWEILKTMGVQHVMNSRSLDFADQIMQLTQGQGVDIVLNSLSGEFIPKSLSVLGSTGRFLEIGKRGVWTSEQVKALRPTAAYDLIDLMSLVRQQPKLIQSMLSHLHTQFQTGVLKPLPHSLFSVQQIIPAFRQMQQAKHIGKIVVSQVTRSNPSPLVHPNSTYLITGGLGGLGLLTAEWLHRQGATHVVLTGRQAPTAAALRKIQQLEKIGLRVTVTQTDVAERSQLSDLIHSIEPPLRGIIHAAGVLDDGLLQHLNEQRLKTVMSAKIAGAWHLHELTQALPIDFFVLFSSAASLLGSPGQANHVAANLFLDALAQHRQAIGLPGISINWGVWSDVGSAADRVEQMRLRGVGAIAPQQGLRALEHLLQQAPAQMGVIPIDWETFRQQGIQSPFFEDFQENVVPIQDGVNSDGVYLEGRSPILQELIASDHPHSCLVAYLQTEVGRVLGLPSAQMPKPRQGFFDLGLDSLMTVELKNRLETSLAISLSSTVIFEHPTIHDLAQHLLQDHLQIEKTTESAPPLEIEPLLASQLVGSPVDPLDCSIMAELTELETLLKRS